MPISDLTDAEFEVLAVHEFTPRLTCDHPSHEGQPTVPIAEWRVQQQHSHSQHCDTIRVALCAECVARLVRLDSTMVRCRRCGDQARGRDWWTLLGRV